MLLHYLPSQDFLTVPTALKPVYSTYARNRIQSCGKSSIRGKFHSALPGKGKALAWAGVPSSLCKQLSAGEWVKGPLAALGGKGGGKPTNAQGQGPNIDQIPEALKAAEAFAQSKLS